MEKEKATVEAIVTREDKIIFAGTYAKAN